jgi:hypothetical protein
MTRYIVPRGFESTAHKIFFEFGKEEASWKK